ncbi:MAG: SPOR domain-containing protein [Magnetococcus sp. WYHC-3]
MILGPLSSPVGAASDGELRLREAWNQLSRHAQDPATTPTAASLEPLLTLVDLLLAEGQPQRAEPVLQQAIRLGQRLWEEDGPELKPLLLRMALVDLARERYDLVIQQLRLLNEGRSFTGPGAAADSQTLELALARARVGHAARLVDEGQFLRQAEELLVVGLPVLAQRLGSTHKEVLDGLWLQGDLMLRRGLEGQAQTHLEEMQALLQQLDPRDALREAKVQWLLGQMQGAQHHDDTAAATLAAALALLDGEQGVAADTLRASLLGDLALIHQVLRQSDAAKGWFERLDAWAARRFGHGSLAHARVLLLVSGALDAAGQAEAAVTWRTRAETMGRGVFQEQPVVFDAWWRQGVELAQAVAASGGGFKAGHQAFQAVLNRLLRDPDRVYVWRARFPDLFPTRRPSVALKRILSTSLTVGAPVAGGTASVSTASPAVVVTPAPVPSSGAPPSGGGPGFSSPGVSVALPGSGAAAQAAPQPVKAAVTPATTQTPPVSGPGADSARDGEFPPPPAASMTGHYVGLGCYSNEAFALEMLRKLAGLGVPLYLRQAHNAAKGTTFFCPVSGPFAQRDAAEEALAQIRGTRAVSEAQVRPYARKSPL